MQTAIQHKQRESNLELFRIIVMLFIVAHHYVVNSDILSIIKADPTSSNALFFFYMGMWGKTGINCFLLITGWFMCTSRITLRKLLKLVLEIEFYKIVIGLVFLITGKESFSVDWLIGLLPIRNIKDGFVPCFLIFYLLIPFLNILVRNLDRKMHLALIGLLVFLYSFLSTIPVFSVTMNYVSWFCTLYIIASYMRLHDFPLKDGHAVSWFWLSVGAIMLSALSVWGIIRSGKTVSPYWFVSDANKVMALVTAICLFNLFRVLNIRPSKFINAVGATTFGVLLIHANSDSMRQWLWYDLFNTAGHLSDPLSPLNAILVILLVFAVCSLLDWIRIVLLETPLFSVYDRYEANHKHSL
ncbi:MAG: acyltransferase [Bacteroidales bacterium]|nr:acyltransferase [Bacteroidales bacterium]